MSQQNQPNVNAKVYLVFLDTGMVDNLIQAWASITMQVLQVPRIFHEWRTSDKSVLPTWQIGQGPKEKKTLHSFVIWYQLLAQQSMLYHDREKRVALSEHIEFTHVMKEKQAWFFNIVLYERREQFEMNTLNALKWILLTLWN